MPKYNFIHTAEAYKMSPADVKDRDTFPIKVVAIAGHGNDWSAYYGPTDKTDEEIAMYGDKLTRDQAEPLFYALSNSGRHYRE